MFDIFPCSPPGGVLLVVPKELLHWLGGLRRWLLCVKPSSYMYRQICQKEGAIQQFFLSLSWPKCDTATPTVKIKMLHFGRLPFNSHNIRIKEHCFCQKHVEKVLMLTSSAGFQDVSVSFCPCLCSKYNLVTPQYPLHPA